MGRGFGDQIEFCDFCCDFCLRSKDLLHGLEKGLKREVNNFQEFLYMNLFFFNQMNGIIIPQPIPTSLPYSLPSMP